MAQHPLFDITPDHIFALDDEGLRELIARLCKADDMPAGKIAEEMRPPKPRQAKALRPLCGRASAPCPRGAAPM